MKFVRSFGKLAFLLCLVAASTAPAFAQSPGLQTGSTAITTPSPALAQDRPSGSKTDKPPKPRPSDPRVTDVSPSYGRTDTKVIIRANANLDWRFIEPVLLDCQSAGVRSINFNTAKAK